MRNLFSKRWFQIFCLAFLVFVLYSFALQGNFKTLDDEGSIVRNVLIKDFRYTGQILLSSYFGVNDYYRPLVLLSYMLEYHFFGLDAYYYYLNNIFIHILTCVLVLGIFGLLFRGRWLALFATLLYAIHPVHWEAVSNIPGRAVLLSTFFTFLSLWLFMLRKKSPLIYLGSWLAFALGLLCKEAAGVLPLVLLSYQFFLGRGAQDRLRKWFAPVLPFFLLILPYLWLRQSLGITELFYVRDQGESLLGFLTFLRGSVTYARLFFFPLGLHFDRSHRFLAGIFNGDVLLILVFYGLCGWLIYKHRRSIPPLAWFLLSWSMIELIPVSQVLVSIGIQPGYISLAEHFLYAAGAGFFGLMVMAGRSLFLWNRVRQILSPGILILATSCFYVFLMMVLIENNIYSSREIAMLERTIRYQPNNGRIRLSLALAYAKVYRFAEAEESFRRALVVDPIMNVRAQIGLGKSLCDQGKYWEGLEIYESIPEPGKLKGLLEENRYSTLQLLKKKYSSLLSLEPNNSTCMYALGVIASKEGEQDSAIRYFEGTLRLKPGFREAWFNLGSSYALQKQWQQAIAAYEKALALSNQDDLLRYQSNVFLARIYQDLGMNADYDKEAARIQRVLNGEAKEKAVK